MIVAGMIACALAVAGAILAPTTRLRALSMLAALVLTPVVLVGDIWDTPQLETLRDRPGITVVAVVAGLVAVAALAVLMARRPAVLALLAVAALPFRVPIESGGSTANLLVPLYVVIGAGALAWMVPRLRDPDAYEPPWRNGLLSMLLAGYVVLYALGAIYSPSDGKALENVVFFYVPFGLLFALLRDLEWTPRLRARCLGVLAVLALVFVAVGFVEFQQRELLLNPKVISSNQVEEYFRVNSLFFDPNIFGRFLAIVMIGLAGVLLWARRPRLVALVAGALAVLWAGLVLTLSQSSFVALLAGLVVLAALRWNAGRALVAAAGVLVVAGAVVLAFPSALRLDLDSSKSVNDATSGRFDLMRGGVELALERPVFGYGSGSFEREYRRRERTSGQLATAASHTIPITVAAEQGVVGLAVFLALLAAALARLLRRAGAEPARSVVAAAFVALVVHTWLYAAFLEDPMAWTLLGVGTALAAARTGGPEETAADLARADGAAGAGRGAALGAPSPP